VHRNVHDQAKHGSDGEVHERSEESSLPVALVLAVSHHFPAGLAFDNEKPHLKPASV
jgi:hypothetical protein